MNLFSGDLIKGAECSRVINLRCQILGTQIQMAPQMTGV